MCIGAVATRQPSSLAHTPAAPSCLSALRASHCAGARTVVYYMWGGYRDCIDVDLLPDSKPVPHTTYTLTLTLTLSLTFTLTLTLSHTLTLTLTFTLTLSPESCHRSPSYRRRTHAVSERSGHAHIH
jgi:hypothetical protein